jgi:hypothetical protein
MVMCGGPGCPGKVCMPYLTPPGRPEQAVYICEEIPDDDFRCPVHFKKKRYTVRCLPVP